MRDYLLNYARSLIYTTSLSYANIIAADCSFDLLQEGEAGKVGQTPFVSVTNSQSNFIAALQEALGSEQLLP